MDDMIFCKYEHQNSYIQAIGLLWLNWGLKILRAIVEEVKLTDYIFDIDLPKLL